MKNRLLVILLLVIIAILAGIWYDLSWNKEEEPESTTSHEIVVERMEAMGKVELVKYHFKDIVQHEKTKHWWPDPKVKLMIVGEAVGCIDLARIDSSHVIVMGDSIFVQLPEPEICYSKIDHNQSTVYDTEYTFWEEAEMVDEAYRLAEKEITLAAIQSGILDQTKIQVELILKPTLETITQKEVFFIPSPVNLQVE